MYNISFEGVLALKIAGVVSTFHTVYSARLQEKRGLKCQWINDHSLELRSV